MRKVRKNIVLPADVEKVLKDIAESLKISQSRVIENLIREKSEEFKLKEKLKALAEIKGILKGSLKDKKIQDLKGEKI